MILRNKSKIIFSLIIFFIVILISSFSFASEKENIDEQLVQLKDILDSSSTYSAFQTTMLLKTAQDLINAGIPFEDTERIIKNSMEKDFNAYSVKNVLDVILENQQEGIPTEPLINKVNEGLAKNADNNTIVSVVSTKAKNLKEANEILNQAREAGLKINGGEEMVKILADSLENDVPQESLTWLLNKGTTEGRSIEEIAEISEEFSYLSLMAYDLGLSPDEVFLIFEKAIDGDIGFDNICEDIQSNLETEISSVKVESSGGKPSAASVGGTSSTSLTGSPTEIGETPTQDAGEAPSQTGGIDEPSTSSGEDTPPPPEN